MAKIDLCMELSIIMHKTVGSAVPQIDPGNLLLAVHECMIVAIHIDQSAVSGAEKIVVGKQRPVRFRRRADPKGETSCRSYPGCHRQSAIGDQLSAVVCASRKPPAESRRASPSSFSMMSFWESSLT